MREVVDVHHILGAQCLAGADGAQHDELVLIEFPEIFGGFGFVGVRLDAVELCEDSLSILGCDVVKSMQAELDGLGDEALRELAAHIRVCNALDDCNLEKEMSAFWSDCTAGNGMTDSA